MLTRAPPLIEDPLINGSWTGFKDALPLLPPIALERPPFGVIFRDWGWVNRLFLGGV